MTYRILSLDGGGAWAVLQVMALTELYGPTTTGHQVLADFDLVAANSGGSIVLGGLIENHTLGDLKDEFFMNEAKRRSVFVPNGAFDATFSGLFGVGPRYSTAGKLRGLQALFAQFGATALSALAQATGTRLPDLLICTFDYDRLRGIVFRSNRRSRGASFTDEIDPTLAEAVHASSTAPVNYFDTPAQMTQAGVLRQFWDGGIAGYNNPVMVAVTEALANGHPAGQIRALSLGTGSTLLPFDPHGTLGALGQGNRLQPRGNPLKDLLSDVSTLATAIVDDPPDVASYLAHVALGGPMPIDAAHVEAAGPVVRLSPMIQPVPDGHGGWATPAGLSDFAGLKHLGMDAVQDADLALIVQFGTAWIAGTVKNQPIRTNRTTLACEIGQDSFERALACWMAQRT
jgi:hypothetical protein